jgi:hypothetical protein
LVRNSARGDWRERESRERTTSPFPVLVRELLAQPAILLAQQEILVEEQCCGDSCMRALARGRGAMRVLAFSA